MPRKAASPLKQPVQARSRHTVQAILEAAVHIFEAHGYAAGTTARIAERAGVSIGSLYQYFPGKDAVIAALAERHLDEVRAFGERMASQPGLAAMPLELLIHHLVDNFVAMHQASPRLHRLMGSGEFLLDSTRKELERLRSHAATGLAALFEQHPGVRHGNHHVMAFIVLESLEHFTHTLVLDPPPRAVRGQVAQELKELLTRYAAVG